MKTNFFILCFIFLGFMGCVNQEKQDKQNDYQPITLLDDEIKFSDTATFFSDIKSPKVDSLNVNPLSDFIFCADPTAVEYNGRLYVYGTNDHQQYQCTGIYGKNSYECIKSLVMFSTDDMVNWTYHGIINTEKIAPWITASWAPSVISVQKDDSTTQFYLYFYNRGIGTGVFKSTSPIGPWTSPLDKSLVDKDTPGLGNCDVPFDPGAVVDDKGIGYLTFGARNARIAKLGKDFISFDGDFVAINAKNHFEANELNFIGGSYVYTYNLDWQEHSDWTLSKEIPTRCCMSYMTSKTPLDSASWEYKANYFKNPGDNGFDYSNNHTHLHKYCGKWYILYHTMCLQKSFFTEGGFRSICVDQIDVNENIPEIKEKKATLKGPEQIKKQNCLQRFQAETVFATQNIKFTATTTAGNMVAENIDSKTGIIRVNGVDFSSCPSNVSICASGEGIVEIRSKQDGGQIFSKISVNNPDFKVITEKTLCKIAETCDIFVILNGNVKLDWYSFEK
ncbi:MAG: family 43 glycosylhydrolase [Bacteroidales bacterium]|nr:family 43 glycosylhydrolase [Bacteroidales bacterium]